MISEKIKRLTLKELTEQEHRCFEIALLALNVGNYEDCEKFTNYGFELDSAVKSGKIEKRYNDGSHYTKDEHGRFTGSTSFGGGSAGGSLRDIGSGGTTSFHSKADPMVEVMGSAEKSHPEEIKAYKEELNNLGVKLIRRKEETLAYSPSLVRGKPGKAYISEGASYSAWSHEMQHVRDDFNDGWTGMRILENPEKRYQREVKAYNVEIKIAESINRPDMVKRLKENLEKERREIYGE